MTKIIHIAPGYTCWDARMYFLECTTLRKAGYDVGIVAQDSFLPATGDIEVSSLGAMNGAALSWNLLARLQRDRSAYSIALKSRADLYHYHSPEFISWAKRLRHTTGRPLIFDCREDYVGYVCQRRGIPKWLRPLLARTVDVQLRAAARNCDAVITADMGTANQLRPFARRVTILHNFPRLDLFPTMDVPESAKIYDLVYHGSIPRYHLEACLAIDNALSAKGFKAHWRFISKSMPEADWFRGELRKRGITDRFRIDEHIAHDQIAREISKAKIGIIPLPDLPKFRNNIPRKLFEFMAVNMPVVMSDLPPSRPFISNGSCGFLVPPDDPAAYADAIVALARNPVLRAKMGDEGRRRIERDFNWAKESGKLLRLYTDLLAA
jgi:glycosyltransferase involved in cell wall biosynthesis